ncbi:MAG: hypothetical protein ACJATT_004836 [Myxococcota bacterium]
MNLTPTVRAAVAHATRLHIPHLMSAWAVLAFAATPLARHATLGAPARGGADWVLGSGWLAVSAVALVVGVLIAQTNTVDGLLIARGQSARRCLVARWAGAVTVALFASVLAGGTYTAAALAWSLPLSPTALQWTGMLALESLVLTSLGCLLGRLARSPVAFTSGAVLFVVGHLADETAALVRAGDTTIPWLFIVLPDLDRFNAHTAVVTNSPLLTSTVVTAVVLAGCWTAALIGSALWVTEDPNSRSNQDRL